MKLLLAIAVAIAIVISAPFVGQLRSWIRATFPGQFVLVVGAIGSTLLVSALIAAAVRIRTHRARRYGAILAALAIAVVYSLANAGENPESNVVERFHFLEYGLMTLLFYRAWRQTGDLSMFILPVFAGLIAGTVEEWFQWFIPNRVGELRDIFLNLAAIVAGLLFSVGIDPPERFEATLRRASIPRVAAGAAITVLALGAFIHALHLGYVIQDPEAGAFTSRYSHERLVALQAEKDAQWRETPPPLVLKRLSREDQYLSEGLAHVRWRNKRWDAGDTSAAWQENLILEKYFVPVLDTPTYEGKVGHRWPVEQRADAASRVQSNPAYVSEAYPYRLYTWPKGVFWLIVGGIAIALLAVAARVR